MKWFVVYTVAFHPSASDHETERVRPSPGDWLATPCEWFGKEVEGQAPTLRRWIALLCDEDWLAVCREQRDLVRPPREPSMGSATHLAGLPAFSLELDPTEWDESGRTGVLEAGMCVSPLPQDAADLEHAKELLDRVAWAVGEYEVKLRCPDCCSPDVEWSGGPKPEQEMGCGNCGARFERGSAYLSVDECEALLPASALSVPGTASGGGEQP